MSGPAYLITISFLALVAAGWARSGSELERKVFKFAVLFNLLGVLLMLSNILRALQS